MLRNVPETWDTEYDVVAIGSGAGGLRAAITANELGASALAAEKSDQVSGVTALSMDYGSDLAILNFVVHARHALKVFEDGIGITRTGPGDGLAAARACAKNIRIPVRFMPDPASCNLLMKDEGRGCRTAFNGLSTARKTSCLRLHKRGSQE